MVVFDVITTIVARLMWLGLCVGSLVLWAYIMERLTNRSQPLWLKWLIGIPIAVVIVVVLIPILDALEGVRCRNVADYEACVDGDSDAEILS